jgi:hypothetical protein
MSHQDDKKTVFANKIKSFDIYRKVPTEITEPTVSGACGT